MHKCYYFWKVELKKNAHGDVCLVTVLFSFLLMHGGLYFVSNLSVLAFFLVLIA